MPKLQTNEKRLFLSFKREDDLALLARLERDAEKQRYPVATYLLLVLHQAYPESSKDAEAPPASSA